MRILLNHKTWRISHQENTLYIIGINLVAKQPINRVEE